MFTAKRMNSAVIAGKADDADKNINAKSTATSDLDLKLDDFGGDLDLWNKYRCEKSYSVAIDIMEQIRMLPSYNVDVIKINKFYYHMNDSNFDIVSFFCFPFLYDGTGLQIEIFKDDFHTDNRFQKLAFALNGSDILNHRISINCLKVTQSTTFIINDDMLGNRSKYNILGSLRTMNIFLRCIFFNDTAVKSWVPNIYAHIKAQSVSNWWSEVNTNLSKMMISGFLNTERIPLYPSMLKWLYIVYNSSTKEKKLDGRIFISALFSVYYNRNSQYRLHQMLTIFERWISGYMCDSCAFASMVNYDLDRAQLKPGLIFDSNLFSNPKNGISVNNGFKFQSHFLPHVAALNPVFNGCVIKKFGTHMAELMLNDYQVSTVRVDTSGDFVLWNINNREFLTFMIIIHGIMEHLKSIFPGGGDQGRMEWLKYLENEYADIKSGKIMVELDRILASILKQDPSRRCLIYIVKAWFITGKIDPYLGTSFRKQSDQWRNVFSRLSSVTMPISYMTKIDHIWQHLIRSNGVYFTSLFTKL